MLSCGLTTIPPELLHEINVKGGGEGERLTLRKGRASYRDNVNEG